MHQDLSDALKAKLDDLTINEDSLDAGGKDVFRGLYKTHRGIFASANASRDLVRFVKLGLKLGIKPSRIYVGS
jgi:hypothetical protein